MDWYPAPRCRLSGPGIAIKIVRIGAIGITDVTAIMIGTATTETISTIVIAAMVTMAATVTMGAMAATVTQARLPSARATRTVSIPAQAMGNGDRITIRRDRTSTGMAMATPADTMATDISTSKPIAAVSFVAMTKVSGAMAAIIGTVEATATIVVFRSPGNEH